MNDDKCLGYSDCVVSHLHVHDCDNVTGSISIVVFSCVFSFCFFFDVAHVANKFIYFVGDVAIRKTMSKLHCRRGRKTEKRLSRIPASS